MALIDNLISYWKLNENAGNTNVVDSHGGNTGTASVNTNVLDTIDGIFGYGFDFEEASSHFINVGNDASLNPNEISIQAWIKMESTGIEDWAVGKWSVNKYGLATTNTGNFFQGVFVTAGGENRPISNVEWSVSTRHHVIVTWDSTNGGKIYMDGVYRGTNNDYSGNLQSSAADTVLGSINTAPALEMDGKMSDIAIWNRPLTDGGGLSIGDTAGGEIAELWNNGNGLAYPFTAVGTNMSLNIADAWKNVDSMQINIGDVWKDVVEVQQNIGDVWKTVF